MEKSKVSSYTRKRMDCSGSFSEQHRQMREIAEEKGFDVMEDAKVVHIAEGGDAQIGYSPKPDTGASSLKME